MRHLDLFSGIGGFALAAKWTWGDEYENVGHSEIEKFPCKVYHKHFPESECLGDITKIDWERFKGRVDLITGGFPCQPHSIAGKRKASGDSRDLWGECERTLRMVRPRFALFENVTGLLTSERGLFFNRVLSDLAKIGYDAEWQVISAADVGAPHLRKRIWIVAYPNGGREMVQGRNGDSYNQKRNTAPKIQERENVLTGSLCTSSKVADTFGNDARSTFGQRTSRTSNEVADNGNIVRHDTGNGGKTLGRFWLPEPNVGRVAHGVPNRVDRLKGLGNAIVPQVAQVIMEAIKQSFPQPTERMTR